MVTRDDVVGWVRQVVDEEHNHSLALRPDGREQRLRKLREIELTSRLRHVVGGLSTFMSNQGADIQSDDPRVDVEVKFPGYWHALNNSPQPASLGEIEADLVWLLAGADTRFMVLFLPCRCEGYAVQKAGGAHRPGTRRFQQCISSTEDSLGRHVNTGHIATALSDVVEHTKKDGKKSLKRQYKTAGPFETATGAPLSVTAVGNPDEYLIWALVIASVAT